MDRKASVVCRWVVRGLIPMQEQQRWGHGRPILSKLVDAVRNIEAWMVLVTNGKRSNRLRTDTLSPLRSNGCPFYRLSTSDTYGAQSQIRPLLWTASLPHIM